MAQREIEIVIKAKVLADKTIQTFADKTSKALRRINVNVKLAERNFKRFKDRVATSTNKILGSWQKLAAGAVALAGSFRLIEEAAKFQQAEQAFANVAASYGANAQKMITDLKEISGQTLSTAEVMQSAGNAMVLGIPADRLSKMMEIARASSRITGQSVQKSFEDISLGVGRGSKMILDNLGIMLDVDKANRAYAASIGKTVVQLTDAEKKTAFLNATMAAGDVIINRIGTGALTTAEAIEKFKAKTKDLGILVGKVMIAAVSGISGALLAASSGFQKVLAILLDSISWFTEQLTKIPIVGEKFKGINFELGIMAEAMNEASIATAGQAIGAFDVASGIFKQAEAMGVVNEKKKEGLVIDAETEAAQIAVPATREELTGDLEAQDELSKIARQAELDQIRLEQLRIFQEQELAMATAHGASLVDIASITSKQRIELDKATSNARLKTAASTAGALANVAQNLNTALGGQSKKAFKAMKGFAIAQALINTYQGATKALAEGGFLGFAAAAAVVASGLAQVQNIRSQQPSGGGGGGSISAGGAALPTRTGGGASAQGVPIRLEEEQAKATQEINITFQADGIIAKDTLSQMKEDLIATINEGGTENLLINAEVIAT